MTTKCSSCGVELGESQADGRFVVCKYCNIFIPIGANSYKPKSNIKEYKNKHKGGKQKMTGEVKEKKERKAGGTTLYVKCSVCGKDKFARKDVYDARVKKFGSIEAMNKSYKCRACKGAERKDED